MTGITPNYRIVANSQDITATIAARLISLRITDESGILSDTLEIIISDSDPSDPVQLPPTGAELEVFLGYDGAFARMGLFVADELELGGWPGHLTIRGRAAAYEKTPKGKTDLQTQKVRSWPKNTKLGDMVAKIAKEHGMDPVVSSSLKSVQLPQFDQTEESDISFLARIAKRYDAIVKPAGGKLLFTKRGESKTASGEDMPTITINAIDATDWRMTKTTREAPGTVIAYWHSTATARKNEIKVGDGDPVKRLRHFYPTAEAAKQGAQAELDKRKRAETKFNLTMPGDTMLAAEAKLKPVGFHPAVAAEWLVTRVVHSLEPGVGYRCEVESEIPKAA